METRVELWRNTELVAIIVANGATLRKELGKLIMDQLNDGPLEVRFGKIK